MFASIYVPYGHVPPVRFQMPEASTQTRFSSHDDDPSTARLSTHQRRSCIARRTSGADLLQLETAADHRDALKIVKKIMKHKNLTEASIKAQLDVAGVNWAHAGEETIDLDFLRSD